MSHSALHAPPIPRAIATRPGWNNRRARVTIIRDDWGIAHVYGKTDADAVFGMIYAQAEDDFNRVETNYLNAMGRLAEAEGESAVFQDLRMKLFIDPEQMKAQYDASPDWLKQLMIAWADGLNFYLLKHPEVHPRVIQHFEPWMALTFSEGSIGGDIESISLPELEAFYGKGPKTVGGESLRCRRSPPDRTAFAIAPANTASHHALLLINPHTSFFFRSELQMVSEEGLNVYGAVTWGQFFVYQGFNDRLGWMHTSSGVDAIDEYAETIVKQGDSLFYRYGSEERPVTVGSITVPYKTETGMARKEFTVYRTQHGPDRPGGRRQVDQCAADAGAGQGAHRVLQPHQGERPTRPFEETVNLRTNSSNNTVYADADGNIAYFQASFIPKRDPQVRLEPSRWTAATPATEWQGLLSLDEMPNLSQSRPTAGFRTPTTGPTRRPGPTARSRRTFPRYVDTYERKPARRPRDPGARGEEGLHPGVAHRRRHTTATSRRSRMLIPPLLKDWDHLPADDPLKAKLAEQVKLLRDWDYRWSAASVPTSLAVFWGEELWRRVLEDADERGSLGLRVHGHQGDGRSSGSNALAAASDKLAAGFRNLEDAVGRHQSLPAAYRRHRAPVQRRGPEYPGSLHLRPLGVAGLLRAPGRTTAARRSTAATATASSRWSSSAIRSGPGRSRPAARAAIRRRSTSTTRRSGTPGAICGRCTSIARSWRVIPSGSTTRGSE